MVSARPRVQTGLSGNYQKVIQRFSMAVRTLQEEDGGDIHLFLPAEAVAVEAAVLGQGRVFWKGKVIGIVSQHKLLTKATSHEAPTTPTWLVVLE